MSQYVSTEDEEMVQVASNLGWSDFCDWVGTLDVDEYPSLQHLSRFGYDNDADMIADEVDAALVASPPADDVRSTAQGLADFVHEHEDAEIILVSNGMTSGDRGEDDGEARALVERARQLAAEIEGGLAV